VTCVTPVRRATPKTQKKPGGGCNSAGLFRGTCFRQKDYSMLWVSVYFIMIGAMVVYGMLSSRP